jgi:hypothetical protein
LNNPVITTYLNDHLAGSVAALELLDHLISAQEGPDAAMLSALRGQIQEDQHILQQLLRELGGKESSVRKAAAWLTEKLGQAKLRLDDPGSGQLRTLESVETLMLGIQGKLSLWRALASVADGLPQLASFDLARLQGRASSQIEQLEQLRLRLVRSAFSSS